MPKNFFIPHTMTTYLDTVPFDCWFSVARWCDTATLEALTKTTKRFKRGFIEDECLDKWDYAAKRTVKEEYYPNGRVSFRTHWVNGEKHGAQEWWHENGKPHRNVPFVHGLRHGVEEEWYENGHVAFCVPWVKGERHGVWEIYNTSGERTMSVLFVNGVPRG